MSCYTKFYNKIIITFNSLNRPLNRLKIKSIDHGSISTFTGGNLKKCNITQKISAISTELPISTASILLKGEAGEEYAFQKRQPLSVFSNDSLQMKLFVKKASRKSKDEWDIQAEDYVGVLDSVSFYGGIYEDESAGNLLIKIFNKAKVPYDIEADIMAETVSGYIPFGTCRNATMQVLFAVGAIIDTSNSEVIKVKRMSQDVSQKIGKERIFQGLRVVDDTRITAVSLTAHTYKAIEDSLIVYDANKSGEGVNIFVKFNEPLHDLSIQDGEILESGHNYAIINAGTNCKLNGQKYEHSSVIKTLYNDLVLSTDTENVKSINKATLVTQKNLDKLLNLCYNYYEKTQTINAKIIERKYVSGGDLIRYGQGIVYGTYKYRTKTLKEITYDEAVRLGDRISIDTSYQGIFTGVVESETFSLSGNSIAKDVLIK